MPSTHGRLARTAALAAVTALIVASGPGAGPPRAAGTSGPEPNAKKPTIHWKPIPFGPKRRRQMAAYSKRHYGRWAWRLENPRVIVEHFTGGNCFSCAWNTFASNSPDLGELPGTCAHFIIDRKGRVFQLVSLSTRCRHTVGLNWVAFGIEGVGTSDAQIFHRRAQIRASYKLTLWLMQTFGIQLRNVIGHNESLMSPYHKELYPSWRCQTHSDWNHHDMRRYRRHLRRLARMHHVPIGPPAEWIDPNC